MRLKDVINESLKIQSKPDHWTTSDHIILVTTAPTKTFVLRFSNKNDSAPASVTFPSGMGSKQLTNNKAAREFWLKVKSDVVKWRNTNESINELTHNEKSIRDGNPNNVYYAFYKGQFEAIYSAMGPSGLFDMYWDKFKVRKPAGSKFKLNPEFVLISKKDYDNSTSNRYAKLKPHVDKLWDILQNESIIKEGRGIKSIQNDLNKTIAAIESEISDYKSTKGTPQEKKHIDNLKKLHPIKKKLEAELEGAVSGLYRDAELKIED